MGDNFTSRYLGNPNDITLKSNFGTIQSVLAPASSMNCTEVPAGFKLEMWASEIDSGHIKSLQNFTFDERGRMWAVETFDYPNTVTAPFAGHDRVVILEDTDGDRVVDKHTVFVTGLNIPQGIEIVPQGIVVAMAPYMLLFEDRNGDDKADAPQGKILYSGFKQGDTHGSISNLRYGMDNWLYADCGYNGGKVGTVTFGPGVLRMRLDGSKFEYYAPETSSKNSAALGMMEDGQIFTASVGVYHSHHAVIPGVATNIISSPDNSIKPITKDLMQGDNFGGFTAASGHEIYTARLFPKEYWNRAAFVSEGTGHLVNVDFLDPVGSTWVTKRVVGTPNIYASSDAWSAPIQTRVGPDGALWILDWYTYIILHNGMLPQGTGQAFEDPALPYRSLRDRRHERIYRVAPADGKLDPVLDLSKAAPEQLVAALGHSNLLWRMAAQKQIIKVTIAPADLDKMEGLLATALSKSRAKDEAGIDGFALHTLWTAEGLGFFKTHPLIWDPILKAALLHPSPAVRMNVAKAMPRTSTSALAIRDQGTVNAKEPHVRLWTILALREMPVTAGITIFTAYHNLDAWSKLAFTRADSGAGITDAAVLPATPALHAVEPPEVSTSRPMLHSIKTALKFEFRKQGVWEVYSDSKLGAGKLTVYDLKGKSVATSIFDGRKWSGQLTGLIQTLYVYLFTDVKGDSQQGRIITNLQL